MCVAASIFRGPSGCLIYCYKFIDFVAVLHHRRVISFSRSLFELTACLIFSSYLQCYRNEGTTPFRPSMPCLVQYKGVVRKDFFGDLPGVVGVHGEPWREFRSRVQKPVLQLTTVRRYVRPLEEVTDYFLERCQQMLDDNQELPDDFDNEIHKWSLECKYSRCKR